MRQNIANINFLAIKVDRGDQAVFITADIKHKKITYFVHARENSTQFVETIKAIFFNYLEPSIQSCLTVRMLAREFSERLTRDNMLALAPLYISIQIHQRIKRRPQQDHEIPIHAAELHRRVALRGELILLGAAPDDHQPQYSPEHMQGVTADQYVKNCAVHARGQGQAKINEFDPLRALDE